MIDWDEWRRNYDLLTLKDQIEFYDEVYKNHPRQEFHTASAVERFLDMTNGGVVTEVGGWTGELAAKMLPSRPNIEKWYNLEVARDAISNSVCDDPRYHSILIDNFLSEWDLIEGDVFIAAHVIEHMKFNELTEMMSAVEADWVYFEAPLLEPGQTWDGYYGSHILEVGWAEVNDMMRSLGYEVVSHERPGDVGITFYHRGVVV